MPISAYRCSTCGHAKDVLQKMSDPLLHTCPSCGAETFTKQVTAAGFQLKGSGWYVTDFKGGAAAPAPAASGDGQDKPAASSDKPDSAGADKKAGDKAADKSANTSAGTSNGTSASPSAAAASPAPAPGGGSSTPTAS